MHVRCLYYLLALVIDLGSGYYSSRESVWKKAVRWMTIQCLSPYVHVQTLSSVTTNCRVNHQKMSQSYWTRLTWGTWFRYRPSVLSLWASDPDTNIWEHPSIASRNFLPTSLSCLQVFIGYHEAHIGYLQYGAQKDNWYDDPMVTGGVAAGVFVLFLLVCVPLCLRRCRKQQSADAVGGYPYKMSKDSLKQERRKHSVVQYSNLKSLTAQGLDKDAYLHQTRSSVASLSYVTPTVAQGIYLQQLHWQEICDSGSEII